MIIDETVLSLGLEVREAETYGQLDIKQDDGGWIQIDREQAEKVVEAINRWLNDEGIDR